MKLVLPTKFGLRKDFELSLDEIAREGARRLLVQAPKLEVTEYVQQFRAEVDEGGKRLGVRNGVGRPRKITMGSGAVDVQCPRVSELFSIGNLLFSAKESSSTCRGASIGLFH